MPVNEHLQEARINFRVKPGGDKLRLCDAIPAFAIDCKFDRCAAGQREGLPIAAMPISGDTLLIPNTVGVIRNAPHADPAQKLFEYLQQPAVLERLIQANALEGKSVDELKTPTLKADWSELVRELNATTAKLKEIFLR